MNEHEMAPGRRAGVLEIRNRSGQVQQRIPFSGDRMTVGRAYDNDIIVGDPYVCAHHLEIEFTDGSFVVRDLDSVNGSYAGRQKFTEMELSDDRVIQFGHSQLRFQHPGSEVAPTWRDISRQGFLAMLDRPWVVFLGLLLALSALVVDTWMDTLENLSVGAMAGEQLYPLIGLLLWTGFWALINRVVSHRANFHVHLAISSLGIAMLFLVNQMVTGIGFAFALDPWVHPASLAGQMAVLAGAIYAHLRYATHGKPPVQFAVALLTGLLLFGAPAVGNYLDRQKFSTIPHLQPLLRPPGFVMKDGQDVEAFFEQSLELKLQLDNETGD